jgi:hypothetical protein
VTVNIEAMQAKRNAFLDLIPQPQRGPLTNDFLQPIRRLELSDPSAICREVCKGYLRAIRQHEAKLNQPAPWWAGDDSYYADLETRRVRLQHYYDVMCEYKELALGFAEWAVWWETLSPKQKEQIRRPQSDQYRAEWMSKQPPTDKQLALLERYGYQGEVPDRQRASDLIDELISLREFQRGGE